MRTRSRNPKPGAAFITHKSATKLAHYMYHTLDQGSQVLPACCGRETLARQVKLVESSTDTATAHLDHTDHLMAGTLTHNIYALEKRMTGTAMEQHVHTLEKKIALTSAAIEQHSHTAVKKISMTGAVMVQHKAHAHRLEKSMSKTVVGASHTMVEASVQFAEVGSSMISRSSPALLREASSLVTAAAKRAWVRFLPGHSSVVFLTDVEGNWQYFCRRAPVGVGGKNGMGGCSGGWAGCWI